MPSRVSPLPAIPEQRHRRILYCLKNLEKDYRYFAWAIQHVFADNDEITVLHMHQIPDPPPPSRYLDGYIRAEKNTHTPQLQSVISQTLMRMGREGLSVTPAIELSSNVPKGIVEYIQHHSPDLVLVGRTRRWLVRGTHTGRYIKSKSPVPVLSVRDMQTPWGGLKERFSKRSE
ncbi:hypothetical protein HDU85_005152 [Gaertneriomyces sp. JEL0708]|nr:hypothetical protein HDU85_005152 [Gaertneriomyces sp. JEL0708]